MKLSTKLNKGNHTMKKTLKNLSVKISPGNTKTGLIPAVSLTPIVSCRIDAPCHKDCYAMKSYRMYPNVRKAWDSNLAMYKNTPLSYFDDINTYLEIKKPDFFRWHVAGDIIDTEYLQGMVTIAKTFPGTNFLCFTKQYRIINDYRDTFACKTLLDNLQIVFSAWPSLRIDNPFNFPVAFCDNGSEARLTGNELLCPGKCDTCGMCWNLGKIGKNVVFKLH